MKYVICGTIPSKSNSYKVSRRGMYKSPQLVQYEQSFALQLLQYQKQETIMGDFAIEVDVYYESKRADLDGCFKILFDSLQKNSVIDNDRKCMKIIAQRHIDKLNPRVEFTITPL